MSKIQNLQGVIPPVATPYTADNKIDFRSLKKLIRYLLQGGVHGLFLLGSTGECIAMNANERRMLLDCALEEVNGKVPVLAGVMEPTTDGCVQNARSARASGVDALVATAAFYTRTNQTETIDHFRYIRQAVESPLIAYDIPVCVGLKLQRETIHTMYTEQLITGIKDSSGDEGNFRMLLRDFKQYPDFRLLTGSEVLADASVIAGAHGCVPGLGNVDPSAYVRLYNAAAAGDAATARQAQERLIDLFQMVFWGLPELSAGAAGVGSFKVALQQMGIFEHAHMRRPNRPTSGFVKARIAVHLKQYGLLP